MNKAEQKLEDFLSDNGICCDTCRYYNKNVNMKNIDRECCIHEMNKQTNAYAGQYFRPKSESFMCGHWMEEEE